jgi:chromosome segregation ATPase
MPIDKTLDEALSRLERGDYKGAEQSVTVVDKNGWSTERAFAWLMVSLVSLEGEHASEALKRLEALAPAVAQRGDDADLRGTISSLQAGRAPLQKERVGALLGRLAVDIPDSRFAQTAAFSYDAKVLKKDPAQLAATLEQARRASEDAASTGERLGAIEGRLILTQDQLTELNSEARMLLEKVGGLGQGISSLESRMILDEGRLKDLDVKVDNMLAQFSQRQAQLERLIERGDPRVTALLNSLRDEMRKLGGAVSQQDATISSLVQQYPALLAAGIQQPRPVVIDVVKLSQETRSEGTLSRMLGYLATAVSVGKTFGRFQVNILGILWALAELAATVLG